MSVSRVREKRMHGLTGGGWKRSPHGPPRQSPTLLKQFLRVRGLGLSPRSSVEISSTRARWPRLHGHHPPTSGKHFSCCCSARWLRLPRGVPRTRRRLLLPVPDVLQDDEGP